MNASESKRRWYVPTSGWLVVGSLVVTALLNTSERFQWFAFNRYKGWTVLIAVASVAVVFVVMLVWWLAALIFRWRFQFSIRSLIVLAVAVAVPCSWLAVEVKKAREQRDAVAAIKKLGGIDFYDWQFDSKGQLTYAERPGPSWLRSLLGEDFFQSVISIVFQVNRITDVELTYLKGMSQLQELDLAGSQVTDAGLENLKGLGQLSSLDLLYTQVTDAGLRHLEGMSQLQVLSLAETKVTDAGLRCLKGLSQLRDLDLVGTKVTDEGVQKLRQALPNCSIDF